MIAAAVIGDVRDVSRFPSRDHFASCNGTAPVEVSPGQRKTCRLSRRGSRRPNHAIHMAAVTQIRYRDTPGRACYDRKTPKEALRALKRRFSDAIFTRLQADARPAATTCTAAREDNRERLRSQRGRLTPRAPALRPSHSRARSHPTNPARPAKREDLLA